MSDGTAGIVAGVVVGVIVIIALVWFFFFRKKNKIIAANESELSYSNNNMNQNDNTRFQPIYDENTCKRYAEKCMNFPDSCSDYKHHCVHFHNRNDSSLFIHANRNIKSYDHDLQINNDSENNCLKNANECLNCQKDCHDKCQILKKCIDDSNPNFSYFSNPTGILEQAYYKSLGYRSLDERT